jgi:TRAP-type transport system small permease protein
MDRTGAVGAFDMLTNVFKLFGAGFAIALVLVLFANIISREVFVYSLAWANEAAVAIFVWMTFIGAGVCLAEQSRIRFTMLADALATTGNQVIEVIVTYVGAVLLTGFLLTSIYATWLYSNQVFATMQFSVGWQWAAVPTGLAFATIGWIRAGTWWPPRS